MVTILFVLILSNFHFPICYLLEIIIIFQISLFLRFEKVRIAYIILFSSLNCEFQATSCGNPPTFDNAIIDYQGRLEIFLGQSVKIKCAEGYLFNGTDETPRYITCSYVNETIYWTEPMRCERPKCQISEFINATKNGPYYIDEEFIYTCPNGINRMAKCTWNRTNKSTEWMYSGNCTGNIPIMFQSWLYMQRCP